MKTEKFILFASIIFILTGMAAAQTSSNFQSFQAGYQYTEPSFQQFYSGQGIDYTMFWPTANNPSTCQPGNDFFVTILPGGCSPQVVRSDLLEQQNVPVFCKMSAIKINPLMDIAEIRSVGFSGKYPSSVLAVSYHPSDAALAAYKPIQGSGVLNDVGYVVVLLKQQVSERNMSDSVSFNLTANIQYDLSNLAGIGKSTFFLPVLKDSDWTNNYVAYSFWNGKGFIRTDYVDAQSAKISIYSDKDTVVRSFDLKLGQTSDIIYLPGFYCRGGMQIRLDSVGLPKPSALLQVDEDKISAIQGTKFLDTCYVSGITPVKDKANTVTTGWNVSVICDGKKSVLTWASSTGNKVATPDINTYFGKAQDAEKEIVDFYANEGTYGPDAMLALGELAQTIGKPEDAKNIYNTLIQKYPGATSQVSRAQSKLSSTNYDLTKATAVVNVRGVSHVISLIGEPKLPSEQDASADFNLGGTPVSLVIGGSNTSSGVTFTLNDLGDDYADISYAAGANAVSTARIKLNQAVPLSSSISLTLTGLHLTRVAGIEILPDFPNQVSTVNFTVNIGIEKRGIKLSPGMMQQKIDNLNSSIKQFSKIADGLEKSVDVMSKACTTTSLVLLAKNLVTGFSGAGIARSKVMPTWNSFCAKPEQITAWGSVDKCLLHYNDQIQNSVSALAGQVNKVNAEMKDAEAAAKSAGTTYDKQFIKDDFAPFVKSQTTPLTDATGKPLLDANNNLVTLSSVFGNGDVKTITDMYTTNQITLDQMKDMMVYGNVDANALGDASTLKTDQLNTIAGKVNTIVTKAAAEAAASNIAGVVGTGGKATTLSGKTAEANIFKVTDTNSNVKVGDNAVLLNNVPSVGNVLIPVTYQKDGTYSFDPKLTGSQIVTQSAGTNSYTPLSAKDKEAAAQYLNKNGVIAFTQSSQTQCHNTYANPQCKIYDSGTFQGKAQVVPVDTVNGWYAATTPDINGISKPYSDAGQLLSMTLCNVGPNGKEEWGNPSADDTNCIDVNFQTGQPLNQLGACFSASEAQAIATQAKSYLLQASAAQFGSKQIKVGGTTCQASAASSVLGARCTDFMSPVDCRILFNVCDPVLCPTSRCNLGGAYPVSDVIQSGIIGGMFLCLPNFPQVIIPVCLTGIEEGMKGYVSLLKSHRDCLQESLTTGKQVGICNEMYSVYECEYIWRQIGPLADALVVKAIQAVLGQNRGGGEYMTVNNAFDSMKASVNYLQNIYTTQIPRLFSVRSVSEAGTQACKGFLSTNYPEIAGLADTLSKPESPVQYSAWFKEIPFSSATVPPTSQYQVYYHIYAGSDTGAYYSVYLASPPETGYYAQQAQYVIASGYINVAGTADETKDFTAPSGYKKLCISVNGQEKCGFQEVSTSFALNYLNDQYMKEQSTEKVTTASACVSGTPSLYSLAQPNIQAGVEEVIQPQIYNRGIVRVCSATNPGQSTEPARWDPVGTCDSAKGIQCWIDLNSVKSAVQGAGIENQTITQIQQTATILAYPEFQGLDEVGTNAALAKVTASSSEITMSVDNNPNVVVMKGGILDTNYASNSQSIASYLDGIKTLGTSSNAQKAQAVYKKFQMYEAITRNLFALTQKTTAATAAPATPAPVVSKCDICGDGPFNNCDKVECEGLGKCYFVWGYIINNCYLCPSACGSFTDSDTCINSPKCLLTCIWDSTNNKCKVKTATAATPATAPATPAQTPTTAVTSPPAASTIVTYQGTEYSYDTTSSTWYYSDGGKEVPDALIANLNNAAATAVPATTTPIVQTYLVYKSNDAYFVFKEGESIPSEIVPLVLIGEFTQQEIRQQNNPLIVSALDQKLASAPPATTPSTTPATNPILNGDVVLQTGDIGPLCNAEINIIPNFPQDAVKGYRLLVPGVLKEGGDFAKTYLPGSPISVVINNNGDDYINLIITGKDELTYKVSWHIIVAFVGHWTIDDKYTATCNVVYKAKITVPGKKPEVKPRVI
jgi:hypothetical protein